MSDAEKDHWQPSESLHAWRKPLVELRAAWESGSTLTRAEKRAITLLSLPAEIQELLASGTLNPEQGHALVLRQITHTPQNQLLALARKMAGEHI